MTRLGLAALLHDRRRAARMGGRLHTILAPAAPGSGWDQTARTMQAVLRDEGISGNFQVTNVPGAGGTIGLAQFVESGGGRSRAADRRGLRHGRRDPDQRLAGRPDDGHADKSRKLSASAMEAERLRPVQLP